MSATICVMVMSSSFFNPSLAFSSHFDTDGAPLSELSWSSSLAVVAVSFSGLFTFIFLMLACLCCKKGDIGFKEFENTEGEEYQADPSALASPASQNGPEVYVLPLTQVSLPVSKQPGRSVQLLKSADLGRHSLLYLKEIGHGWFGKVLLGEVNAGLSSTQVVVKELKASASVQDHIHFLEEAQPYRTLQHPALLQCLAQCSEVTPYLLVMEFCPLGDLKGYLRSCRAADSMTPDPLILQRMACEIASGLLHLHKHNFTHSDLALRNCLLTSEVTVKIGDYGLSHNKYKEDYFVTPDQLWVPLRWIAPELIDEVHGNLLVVDQTKSSNVWSLGVTIWEMFELGNQPYRHYTDRQVLTYAVKEQQLKLPKPLLKVPLSERWYEVMQFCWLQPEQRPSMEEVHLLLSYLCAKGSSEPEEDFESRWNSLRPGMGHSVSAVEPAPSSSSSSSFPLLEHFATGDGFHGEPGDDILTVTESSHGLSFEYKWEEAGPERPFHTASTSGPLGQGNPHYQDIYYPPEGGSRDGDGGEGLNLGVSPSCYEPKPLHTPGVVPVLSAHSPSVSSEYYIRIEEPMESAGQLDHSPEFEGGDYDRDANAEDHAPGSYWLADAHKAAIAAYDSDASPAVSLTMEPLLGQAAAGGSPMGAWESGQCFSYEERGSFYYERSPLLSPGRGLPVMKGTPPGVLRGSWGSPSPPRAQGEPESPLSTSPSLSSPCTGHHDLDVEDSCEPTGSQTTDGEHHNHAVSATCSIRIEIETEDGAVTGGWRRQHRDHATGDEADLFSDRETHSWASNHSANNNSLTFARGPPVGMDLHCTGKPSTDAWPDMRTAKESPTQNTYQTSAYSEGVDDDNFVSPHKRHPLTSPTEHCTYVNMCFEVGDDEAPPHECRPTTESPSFLDLPTGAMVRDRGLKEADILRMGEEEDVCSSTRGGGILSKTETDSELWDKNSDTSVSVVLYEKGVVTQEMHLSRVAVAKVPAPSGKRPPRHAALSEADSGAVTSCSSVRMVDIEDYDDIVLDVASGVFVALPMERVEVLPLGPLQKQAVTPDSVDSMELTSTTSSCEAFSPASFHSSTQPKALDSGYDTENNESPEFIPKELPESRDLEGFTPPSGKVPLTKGPELGGSEDEVVLQVDVVDKVSPVTLPSNSEPELTELGGKNPYRDSAYFSDYDTENERFPCDEAGGEFPEIPGEEAEKGDLTRSVRREGLDPPLEKEVGGKHLPGPEEIRTIFERDTGKMSPEGSRSEPRPGDSPIGPVLSTLSPSPPEMGGCLTKESSQDEGLGLDPEHSGEEPASECSSSPSPSSASSSSSASSALSASSSTLQESCATGDTGEKASGDPEAQPQTCDGAETIKVVESGDKEKEQGQDSTGGGNDDIWEEVMEDLEEDDMDEEQQEDADLNKGDAFPEAIDIPSPSTASSSSSSPPSLLPAEGGGLLLPGGGDGDGDEADWEDRDSEDSEESDEELRSYNVQEPSEESEEECQAVPVVVSDCSDARHLRSLLRMPTLLTESFCDELEHRKKAVSFFDDVTVYLFDQESPTQELAEQGFPPGAEPAGQCAEGTETRPQERLSASDDSSDGNISEESGGFEWEDDFPLVSGPSSILPDSVEPQAPSPTPEASSPTPEASSPTPEASSLTPEALSLSPEASSPSPEAPTPSPEASVTPPAALATPFSRFSVSRFSITHVSDSDVNSGGDQFQN
ncbi:serine/threonine-protein kinase LMTK1-like [Anguilla rostrata]|uniref:serine/threonine-protein kinase LMTK1-like n=1 Tax=Anguilla rostrata TaxID=7938 RepID=UPI0030CE46ED